MQRVDRHIDTRAAARERILKLVWHRKRISPHQFAKTKELAGETFSRNLTILKRDTVDRF
jgi:hypothetical protein